MAVTKDDLKAYCKPFMKRKSFSFNRLEGLVDNPVLDALGVARAFGQPCDNVHGIITELNGTSAGFKRQLKNELTRLSKSHAPHHELMACVQKHLINHGVYAEYRRPASVGLILAQREACGVPVYFLLGESAKGEDKSRAFGGRVVVDQATSKPTSVIVYVSGAIVRLTEQLDLWLGDIKNRKGDVEIDRYYINLRRDLVRTHCDLCTLSPDDMPLHAYLLILSMRATVNRFRNILVQCTSPEVFIIRALNVQLDSLIAHETSHLVERKANGSLAIDAVYKELFAYLLEAKYSNPDAAFLSLLHRYTGQQLRQLVPRLMNDVRKRVPSVILEGAIYLRSMASDMLDDSFIGLTGEIPEDKMDIAAIKSVQTSDFLNSSHLPVLERALYKP